MTETASLQYLRSFLRERVPTVALSAVEPLHDILCVGGRGTSRGLKGNDRFFFEVAISYLAESGIPIDPDFQIEICNLDPAYGGQDFLTCESKADLIFFMFLFNPPPKNIPYFSQFDPSCDFIVSPLHSPPAFRAAIFRSDARAVMCRSTGGTEIDENFILGGVNADRVDFPYDRLTSTHEHSSALCRWDDGDLSRVFRCRLSVPGGILLRRDFAAALSSGLPPQMQDSDYDTLLHKRIAEWTPG